MRLRPSGSVWQGGLSVESQNYGHTDISAPVIGIVLSVFYSDDPLNIATTNAAGDRGPYCMARVRVLSSTTETPMILPNVWILPTGASGHDDFSEELPQGVTDSIDGRSTAEGFDKLPTHRLNGDYCVVAFIGGSVHQPVMLSWFPHPGNTKDAATTGHAADSLENARRSVKRFQGVRLAITSEGTLHLDTSKANHKLSPDRTTRSTSDKGGDIKVSVKPSRNLSVDFNKPVYDETEPDVLWEREEIQNASPRSQANSRWYMDKDFIQAVAGEVVQIAASQNLYLGADTATENFVLGQELKTLLASMLNALITHTHVVPPGIVVVNPSLVPIGTTLIGDTLPSTEAATWSDNLSDVQAETILSDWIFGQKEPPPREE